MRKVAALLLALLLPVLAVGCARTDVNMETGSTTAAAQSKPVDEITVGISLPNDTLQRWIHHGEELVAGLQAMGYRVILEHAGDDAPAQAEQIKEMIGKKVDCLVIAAVDAYMLTDVLDKAKDAQIPVIAYDRLLMNTDALACYVGVDNLAAGTAMADYIVKTEKLGSAQADGRSHTIEFFMGSPEDSGAILLHQGIMTVLQPYFDSGVLVSRTGRTAFEDVCTQDWSAEAAKADCERYLTEHYTDALPDILCAASDSLAKGCRDALEAAQAAPGESWPLITGRGAELETVKALLSGHQSMTVYADQDALIQDCLTAAKAILTLTPLQTGDAGCYNGAKFFPAFLTAPVAVDAENYGQVLVDSGVFTEEQTDAAEGQQ